MRRLVVIGGAVAVMLLVLPRELVLALLVLGDVALFAVTALVLRRRVLSHSTPAEDGGSHREGMESFDS